MSEEFPLPASPAPGPLAAPASATWGTWLTAGLALAGLAYLFRGLVLPLLLAIPLAYLLSPLVDWVQGLAIRRSVAVTGVFAALALVLLASLYLLLPRARAEGAALVASLPPQLERGIRRAATEVLQDHPLAGRFLPRIPDRDGWLLELLAKRLGHLSDLVGRAGTAALVGLLAPLFSFFMLRDSGRLLRFVMDRLHPEHIETTVAVWCEIDRIIGRYLRGLALDASVVGALAAVGLWALGVPYPLLLGLFSASVNPVPYLGPAVAVAAAVFVALATGGGFATVGWILLLYASIRVLDDALIALVTIGSSVRLHPMLVLASIIAGEQALGLVGMVIAVPAVTVFKEIARLLIEHRRTLARAPDAIGLARPEAGHIVC